MALGLLNCSICPKQPKFSDTSHLLTHVSSKGHLAHLHKIQVRSHQEISASLQIATYDQWYQQHDLGRLLSERMLQKEAKQSNKRGKAAMAQRKVKNETQSNLTGYGATQLGLHTGSAYQAAPIDPQLGPSPWAGRTRGSDYRLLANASIECDSSPTKNLRRRKTHPVVSPIKRSSSDEDLRSNHADNSPQIDPSLLESPENSKLKGVVWPGMDLFDAATAEMRRRRNQKKDGSALIQMERSSRTVEPTEVIYSPEGTVVKQRVITGMVEDSSSPLKGESPIPKKLVRQRRPPLAEVSGNVTRKNSRPSKTTESGRTARARADRKVVRIQSSALPSSSLGMPHTLHSQYSPTEDENMEFKLMVGHLGRGKRDGNFTIFDDRFLHLQNASAETVEDDFDSHHPPLSRQQARPQIHLQNAAIRTPMPFLTTPWLQPQFQQSLAHRTMTQNFGPPQTPYLPHPNYGFGKENVHEPFGHANLTEHKPNPLDWNRASAGIQHSYSSYHDAGYGTRVGLSGLPSHDDVFGYTANPLCASFQHLHNQEQAGFAGGSDFRLAYLSPPVKKRSLSPDGTVSDLSLPEYPQGVFATSE